LVRLTATGEVMMDLEKRFALGEVDTFGLFENDVDDEVEDPLMGTARDLAGQAKRWDELSLAERLVHQHTPRGATS
jgi:hypothetical protein